MPDVYRSNVRLPLRYPPILACNFEFVFVYSLVGNYYAIETRYVMVVREDMFPCIGLSTHVVFDSSSLSRLEIDKYYENVKSCLHSG